MIYHRTKKSQEREVSEPLFEQRRTFSISDNPQDGPLTPYLTPYIPHPGTNCQFIPRTIPPPPQTSSSGSQLIHESPLNSLTQLNSIPSLTHSTSPSKAALKPPKMPSSNSSTTANRLLTTGISDATNAPNDVTNGPRNDSVAAVNTYKSATPPKLK